MPDKDWKKEMKQILGNHLIVGEDAELQKRVMEIAGDRDLDEVRAELNAETRELSFEMHDIENLIQERSKEITIEYNHAVSDANYQYEEDTHQYNYDIGIIEQAEDRKKKNAIEWNAKVKGKLKDTKGNDIPDIETIRNNIMKEKAVLEIDGREYPSTDTETYKNLPENAQGIIDSYMWQFNRIENLPDYEEKLEIYENAISQKKEALIKAEKNRVEKMDSMAEKVQLREKDKVYRSKFQDSWDIQNYQDKVLPKAEAVTAATLSDEGKEKGLDLLASARAEYKNSLNGWQRMWANILPSSLYGPAKYVDRINAYKAALSETGVSKQEIEFADPEKDVRYSKDENGKFVKSEKAPLLPEEKEKIGRNKNMSIDLQKGLGIVTGEITTGEKSAAKGKTDPTLNVEKGGPKK